MSKSVKKEQQYHNGIPVDSLEEVAVLQWLEELIEHGYVERVKRSESFTLASPITNTWKETVELKTKNKVVEKKQKILEEHVYTPEFEVQMTDIGAKKLVNNLIIGGGHKMDKVLYSSMSSVVYLEVKPAWDHQNMTRLFKINQKWMAEKYGIFVNLIESISLFEKTFTPAAYLKTKTGKPKVVHHTLRTIEEYIQTL